MGASTTVRVAPEDRVHDRLVEWLRSNVEAGIGELCAELLVELQLAYHAPRLVDLLGDGPDALGPNFVEEAHRAPVDTYRRWLGDVCGLARREWDRILNP